MFFLLFTLLIIQSLQREQEVLLGPIIGKVTENTARILIEFNIAGRISLGLHSLDYPDINHFDTLDVLPNRPSVFKFNKLKPGVKYFLLLEYPFLSGESSFFRTLSGSQKLNIAFISCNHLRYSFFIPLQNNLWTDLGKRVTRGEISYAIHIGDQVYLDSEEWSGREDSAYSRSKNQYPDFFYHIEEIREIIREDYRKTFGYKPTALVLSRVPNIMILDDHEVHNDFGRRIEFRTKGTFDEFWSTQARFVYYEYQRQLREDIDLSRFEEITEEYFKETLNDIDLFFIDYRTGRIWNRNLLDPFKDQDGYLEKKQEIELVKFFSRGSNVKILVNSLPVFLFDPKTTHYLAHNYCIDYDELWTYKNEKNLISFFDLIRRWKKLNEDNKLLLVAGDQHYGIHSEIFYKCEGIFKQLTTSGIVMDRIEENDIKKLDILMNETHCLSENYCINHYKWSYSYNYGIVEIENSKITSQLVLSDGKKVSEFEKDEIDNYMTNIDDCK